MIFLVGLTALVWVRMYVVRLKEIGTKRIDPQSISTSRGASRFLEETAPADNFRNLFEIPVLFYAVCLALTVADKVTPLQIMLAWTFVILRVAHSLIHLSYNRVTHRFAVHVLGMTVVLFMWVILAFQLGMGRQ